MSLGPSSARERAVSKLHRSLQSRAHRVLRELNERFAEEDRRAVPRHVPTLAEREADWRVFYALHEKKMAEARAAEQSAVHASDGRDYKSELLGAARGGCDVAVARADELFENWRDA